MSSIRAELATRAAAVCAFAVLWFLLAENSSSSSRWPVSTAAWPSVLALGSLVGSPCAAVAWVGLGRRQSPGLKLLGGLVFFAVAVVSGRLVCGAEIAGGADVALFGGLLSVAPALGLLASHCVAMFGLIEFGRSLATPAFGVLLGISFGLVCALAPFSLDSYLSGPKDPARARCAVEVATGLSASVSLPARIQGRDVLHREEVYRRFRLAEEPRSKPDLGCLASWLFALGVGFGLTAQALCALRKRAFRGNL